MKISYISKSFRADTLKIIQQAEAICDDYARQGYDLTLRQLYYQFVAKGLIPNKDTEYDRLGSIINDARLAGLLDWEHITDRTRNLASWIQFENPAECIEDAASSYGIDLWEDQENRVEVWVEKEALAGVVSQVASRFAVPYFSCRGYVSQSEMHAAGRRLAGYRNSCQHPVIIHLGDHDPSGIDMTRDLESRLRMFMTDGGFDYEGGASDLEYDMSCVDLTVNRIALNMEQIRLYNPPPNPAKLTDSRCTGYIKLYGNSSWELDALSPRQMDDLISNAIRSYLDMEKWQVSLERQRAEKSALIATAQRWSEVEAFIQEGNSQ